MITPRISFKYFPIEIEKTIMDAEELANKYSMNDIRPLAKKYGFSTRCINKIDIIKLPPKEAITELEKK